MKKTNADQDAIQLPTGYAVELSLSMPVIGVPGWRVDNGAILGFRENEDPAAQTVIAVASGPLGHATVTANATVEAGKPQEHVTIEIDVVEKPALSIIAGAPFPA